MAEKFIRLISPNKSKPFSIILAGITYPDPDYHIQRKQHYNIFCFEYILSGKGIVRTNGKEYHVSKGDSYMLLPGREHDYFSDPSDPMKKIWFNASGSLINILIDLYRLDQFTVFKHLDTSSYILKIHTLLRDQTRSPLSIQDEYTLIFHELLQYVKNHTLKDQYSPAQKIKDYIIQNAFDNLKIKDMAKLIYHSESQTIRIFKEAFGITPYKYLLECKLNHAKNMLLSSSMSITEIAKLLNFSDEHYFSNIFKEKVGISPKHYRMQDSIEHKIKNACTMLLATDISIAEISASFQFPDEDSFSAVFTRVMGTSPLQYRLKNKWSEDESREQS